MYLFVACLYTFFVDSEWFLTKCISFNKGELRITESILNNNTADYGGAIYNNEEKSFNIKNCKLENNKPNDVGYKDN